MCFNYIAVKVTCACNILLLEPFFGKYSSVLCVFMCPLEVCSVVPQKLPINSLLLHKLHVNDLEKERC